MFKLLLIILRVRSYLVTYKIMLKTSKIYVSEMGCMVTNVTVFFPVVMCERTFTEDKWLGIPVFLLAAVDFFMIIVGMVFSSTN